ncbi:hypothetical protein AGDE_04124 [Angomonas deanei]|uniref:Uncharacterized protein n=1 Tax=Angomonas deanei TaxID=59799 RepID=A0A7G2CN88_9TRYP|nr:hypothetical protein AGDE_04124 [Angomonas deanei]CAD2220537.1 hypothetical protein, conserved [Angomonas deanei]|eukprot:EPY39804.1 hypothetical protein AGDE_04124 [Angomonas deanei]
MRHHLSAHSLKDCVRYGTVLLQHHKQLTAINAQQKLLAPYRVIKQVKLAINKRYHAFQIFRIRLTLRSWTAISDLLVYCLFVTVTVLLYAIYRACRVGVNRAEERYRMMAIPILQTFEALEEAQQRRLELRKELEEDVVRTR